MSINKAVITGNLTRDCEFRTTQNGGCVANFSVAVNDRIKGAGGEWQDYANFIPCVMFGKRAESLSKYLLKGQKVAIEGKLRWSSWESEGQKRSKIEIIIDDIELIGSRQQHAEQTTTTETYTEDVPF